MNLYQTQSETYTHKKIATMTKQMPTSTQQGQ